MMYEPVEQPQNHSLLRCCEDIRLSEGSLSCVYIGPGGIYAIAQSAEQPQTLYLALRNLLGTARIRIYFTDNGLYDAFSRRITETLSAEALEEQIFAWTCPAKPMWSVDKIALYVMKLQKADSFTRGQYTDEEGNLYLLRNGEFRLTSPLSSERMYYLTLFAGVLGFHRFYAGKYASGLFYLCTGGAFGIGWLLDLLSVLTGVQKDKSKRYFAPLSHPLKKISLLPLGFLTTALSVFLQTSVLTLMFGSLNAGTASQMQQIDSDSMATEVSGNIQQFVDWLSGYFGE